MDAQTLTIRPATEADLPVILSIFRRARRFMAADGNPRQWSDGYPPQAVLEADIRRGEGYVFCRADGAVCGVFALVFGDDPDYAAIDGAWPNDRPYATVHRLAGDGTARGLTRLCLDFCKNQASVLRADTHADNHRMQHLLCACGFQACGVVTHDGKAEYPAYQWSAE